MKASLALQLRLGFAIALALALGISAAAWWVAAEYRNDVRTAYGAHLRTTVQLAEAESALWQLRYGFPQFMIGGPQDQQRILDEQNKWYAIVDDRLEAYAKTAEDAHERRALTDLRAAYSRYKDARPKFFELWLAGEKDEAIAWRALTTTPFGAQTVKAFDTQIALRNAVAERAAAESDVTVGLALALVTGITIALLGMLAAGYAYLIRMLRPIRDLQAHAASTVETMLGTPLEPGRGNEVLSLVDSVERMSGAFAAHAREIERTQQDLQRLNAELETRVTDPHR
jgi:methyl-accepting chemotaxis protein